MVNMQFHKAFDKLRESGARECVSRVQHGLFETLSRSVCAGVCVCVSLGAVGFSHGRGIKYRY